MLTQFALFSEMLAWCRVPYDGNRMSESSVVYDSADIPTSLGFNLVAGAQVSLSAKRPGVFRFPSQYKAKYRLSPLYPLISPVAF